MKQMSVRWIVFGCVSRSSVGVDVPNNPNKNNHAIQNCTRDITQKELRVIKITKQPLGLRLPKAALSHGIQRLIRSLKTVSRLFVYKNKSVEGEKDDDDSEIMEIGYPTDVKHLTHIGWDGSTTTTMVSKACKEWDESNPSQVISLPSISLKQFELAMAQQAVAAATAVQSNI
ncbi:hypothetical protein vseg_007788 [Gypsophila vaccaria]